MRLNECKESISALINQISNINNPVLPFHELTRRKDGFIWTKDAKIIEKLVVLGVAVGILEYYCPKQQWDRFPYGLPPVIKSDVPSYPVQDQK